MGDSETLGGGGWLYQKEDGEDKEDWSGVTQLALTER